MNAMAFAGLHPITQKKFLRRLPQDHFERGILIKGYIINHFKLHISAVEGNSRKHDLVMCRQICMYFLRKKTLLSLKRIGGMFSDRDHATVIYAVNTVEDLIDTDPKYNEQVVKIEKLLAEHKL